MRYACILIIIFISAHLSAEIYDGSNNKLDAVTAEQRLAELTIDVDLPLTLETQRLLDIYTYSFRPGARRIMEKGNVYFPSFEYKLETLGLPDFLKNLAIVESNMDPWSFSSRGAVGVWQLMSNTAKSNGLVIDRYVDERFDPIMSSTVAFSYMNELYEYFNDWELALIAYNCGPAKLRKAIRSCNSYDPVILRDVLPKESVKYLSRLAAASYLSKFYADHGIRPKNAHNSVRLGSIRVYDYITYKEISKFTGLSQSEISEYNPAIIYNYLPANDKGYMLSLPIDKLIPLAMIKDWDLANLADIGLYKDIIQSALSSTMDVVSLYRNGVFKTSKIRGNKKSAKDEEGKDTDVESPLALRREQILKLESLS